MIPSNIQPILDKFGELVADNARNSLRIHIKEGVDGIWEETSKIESPIEQVMWGALETIRVINGIQEHDVFGMHGDEMVFGLFVRPQYIIGDYRADFLVRYFNPDVGGDCDVKILVECDSQIWHERTEPERRAEKERDRFFQQEGFKVFHYTGTEILANPLEIAKEIIVEATNLICETSVVKGEGENGKR